MRFKPDWFAIVYVAGVFLIAHVAGELHDSGWMLILASYWTLTVPLVYWLGMRLGRAVGLPQKGTQ